MKADWIAPDRTALVLIDFQVDFAAPDGAMARRGADVTAAQAALPQARALLEAARGAKAAIVFVRLITRPGSQTRVMREARQRQGDSEAQLCLEGTPGADFTGVLPGPGDILISKSRFSAFAPGGLAGQLRARNIDTLVLAGLTTECCVAATAWDGFEADFHIFIAADACAAYAPDLHDGALKALELSGAVLGKAEAFAQAWEKSI